MSQQATYRNGVKAFNAGDFGKAFACLKSLNHPQAAHLAAISAQKLDRSGDAEVLFRKASKLAPTDSNIANNFGHFLVSIDQFDAARTQFLNALKTVPRLAPALIGLAKIEAARKNWASAGELYERVLEASPNSLVGRYGLATAYLESGKADAAAAGFEQVIAVNRSAEAVFMLGRARLEQNKTEDALACFHESYTLAPTEHALRNLANLVWMKNDIAGFNALVDAAPSELRSTVTSLLVESGQLDRADRKWTEWIRAQPDSLDAWLLKANIARAQQDAEELGKAADRALAFDAQAPAALDARIVADLMQGDAEQALARLHPLRRVAPHSQHWIAHEFVAHRMLGIDHPFLDLDRFVRAYDLPIPPGYETLDAFNRDLAKALKSLHKFQARPLNQSLRGTGSQTTLSLNETEHAVIQTYTQALRAPIEDYLSEIGHDPSHPTAARNSGTYKFKGIWSVLLRGGGFHEPHVHPDGWVSSAYYVTVPPETADATDRAGWIKFGDPPYKIPEGTAQAKWICPQPGRLVLFPSFVWHGTQPIADQSERLTAPFDLIP